MCVMDLAEREVAESLLGLSGSYTVDDIDAAYRDFARANHPDRASDAAERRVRTEKMRAANRYKSELAAMFASKPVGYSVPSVEDVEEDVEAEEEVSRWWDDGAGSDANAAHPDADTPDGTTENQGHGGFGEVMGNDATRPFSPDASGDGFTNDDNVSDATTVMPSRQHVDQTVPMPRPVGYVFPDAPYAEGMTHGIPDTSRAYASDGSVSPANGSAERHPRGFRLPLSGSLDGWASANDGERGLMAEALADRMLGTPFSRVGLRIVLGIAMGMMLSGIVGNDGAASLVPLLLGCGEVLFGFASRMVIGIVRKVVRFFVPFAGELLDGGRFLAKVCRMVRR